MQEKRKSKAPKSARKIPKKKLKKVSAGTVYLKKRQKTLVEDNFF